jgi:hypothetical protein
MQTVAQNVYAWYYQNVRYPHPAYQIVSAGINPQINAADKCRRIRP